ncbi:MAG: SH3 domain-containing protein [Kiritimatiellae bacterium]|nr:SH3 domain-containing protein [Kiritimatiellia bacterium]
MKWKRFVAMAGLLALGPAAALAAPKALSVQVKKGDLRDKPSFLGAIVATLEYGARVELLEEKGAWQKVVPEGGGSAGWIHASALTRKRIRLAAGKQDAEVAASSEEMALAGKGFNKEVEAEFKTRNKDIDFTWIDRMERWRVSSEQMQAFLKEGAVEPAEGGAE